MPFAQLWGKTYLCGTSGAPMAPLCFNGSPYQPIPIAQGVDPQRALSLLEQPENFPGIGVGAQPVRHYPHLDGLQASHVLGYLDRATVADVNGAAGQIADTDLVGRSGLEAEYDVVLRGVSGRTTVSIDPRSVVTGQISATSPIPGLDVITHLSAPIQAASEKALTDAITAARSRGWAAVIASVNAFSLAAWMGALRCVMTSRPGMGLVAEIWPVTTPLGSMETVVRPLTPRSTTSYSASRPDRPTRSVSAICPAAPLTSATVARSR